MTIETFYQTFSSDCTASSGNQLLYRGAAPCLHTGRVAYRLAHGGSSYALLFSNQVDSTFSDGTISKANDIGGIWKIRSMRVGLTDSWDAEPGAWQTVTFEGRPAKTVSGAEVFCTDPILLSACAGQYLCYEITLFGSCFPYHEEMVLNVRKQAADGTWYPDKAIPVPLMIGSDRSVTRRIGFIGDSITQGCGTESESYTHWAAKIAEGLPASCSVWNLGIGYARGYDAATDRGWLARAKTCDTVNICFGVNDLLRGRSAEEVLCDLHTIVCALKAVGCQTILFTVPPFDMTGEAKEHWYLVNDAIRSGAIPEADQLFDSAAVLGQPAPNTHRTVYGGHPNAEGCAVLAAAYLKQKLL